MRKVEQSRRRPSGQPVQHLGFKWTVFVLLMVLPLLSGLKLSMAGHYLPLAAYGLLSVVTFGLYWHDKRRAMAQGQRTPENLLHASELLGGWPGALIAQQAFRHKTRKVSYQLVFWLIVLVHQAFWVDQIVLGGRFLGLGI
jgi:uncharacterized membrane protein YsdA (DUF1294 family)